ncbi:Zinc finger, CCHC-type [Sesbania bispinosa]|nr:Zinc finger, CCHC-type [Sesbania bispinosa]
MPTDNRQQENNTSNPPSFIIYDEEDVVEGVELCSKSLIGKIITQKPIHLNSVQSALEGIWCNPVGFRMEEIFPKTFQFFFGSEEDTTRVLGGSPWLFRNSWLGPIVGFTPNCRTPKMGRKVGACLGRVEESEVYEGRDKITFVKLLVEVNTHKPLLPGIPVGSHMDGVTWVDFRYERLPQFCYMCGHIGHDEDSCKVPTAPNPDEDNGDKVLGPWLRASQVGRKIAASSNHPKGDTRERPNPKSQGNMSRDVIALLSALKVTSETPQCPPHVAPPPRAAVQ